MKLETKSLIAGLSLAASLGGCATLPPFQLVAARTAYVESANSQTAKVAPTALYDAEKALDRANQEFAANGDTLEVRDYAYIALRKVELADVKARTELDRQNIAAAVKMGIAVRDGQVTDAKAALADSREQIKDERRANDAALASGREQIKDERRANDAATTELKAANAAQGKELDDTAAKLDAEKQARLTAESKLAGAMKDLATIAAIKDEPRGVVITLSGSVLFASNKFALLETAKNKLDHVAEALKAQSDDRRMVVEGHTDSRGSDATNQPLSLNRATAVLDYLVGRGVDSKKITAVGMGSSRPLLDNGNAENRANNRRVEIIIQRARMTSN